MDTQQNDGKNNTDDSTGVGGGSDLSKAPNSSMVERPASLPVNSSENVAKEPPANIPFADDPKEEEKKVDVSQNKINSPAKVVPGARGPLPSAPAKIMKASTAKFGIGTPLKSSSANNVLNKPEKISMEQVKPDLASRDNIKSGIPTMSKPKIGVPPPPKAPEPVVGEVLKKQQESKTQKNVAAPSAQKPQVVESANVDRNIRPRRLAIVLITLIVFIVAIIFCVWFFFVREDTGTAANTQVTEQPLTTVSSSPSATIEPTPAGSLVSQQNVDTDGDGLTDAEEQQLGTDQLKADTDGDGYTDKQEIDSGYDPLTVGGKLDSDRDGLADPDEKCWGTDAHNPDTDGDGYLDGQEVVNGFDPIIPSPNDKLTAPSKCSI